MAYHRRVDVMNGTAAKGTYYDVNKAAEVHNKTRATYKTCNYNAFFSKKDTNKWTFLKGIQTHQTKYIRNRWRPQLQNFRIYYSQNRCFLPSKDFCLLWFLKKIICMMHDATYQSA